MSLDESKTLEMKQLMASQQWSNLREVTNLDTGEVLVGMYIQPELSHFEGHFPDQPVLPGVVQTHWAGELGKLLFNIETEFSGMENIKFSAVILPEKELSLSLIYNESKKSLAFKYFNDSEKFSEGRIRFES